MDETTALMMAGIPTGDMMAFRNLAECMSKLLDGGVLIAKRDEMNERHRRMAEFGRIDECSVAGDNAEIFHPPDPFRYGWREKPNPAARFAE